MEFTEEEKNQGWSVRIPGWFSKPPQLVGYFYWMRWDISDGKGCMKKNTEVVFVDRRGFIHYFQARTTPIAPEPVMEALNGTQNVEFNGPIQQPK